MIRKLSNWIGQNTTGKIALVTLIIMLLFTAFVLPNQSKASVENTGSSESPDTSFFYSPGELYSMAETYGLPGREAYIQARWSFDLIFPMIYIAFLTAGISWFLNKLPHLKHKWQLMNLSPLLGGIFDYLENSAASLLMFLYPTRWPGLAWLTAIFSGVKWLLISVSFIAYFYIAAAALIQWYKNQKQNSEVG